jgi:outer membrane protein assembly factor BamB
MKSIRLALWPGLIVSIVLSGCSTLSGLGSDNTPKPAPLINFKAEYAVKTVWTRSATSGVDDDYLRLGPVAANGRIFTADAAGKVIALNAGSGATVWKANAKAAITSGPAVGAGLVVVGTADAQVIAFNEHTGTLVWRTKVPNQVLAAPQITSDRIIITTISGKLCALSTQNGQQIWEYDHGAPTMVLRGGSLPQIADNKVIVGFADGKLGAFDLGDGHLIWQQTIAMPQGAAQVQQMVDIVADPVIADGIIYVATYQGKIAAVSLQTGQINWLQNISSYTGLALGPQQVFVTDASGNVWAFARNSGQVLWTQNQLVNRKLAAPALIGNTVVIPDGEGYLHWLSQTDGHEVARALISKDKAILATPVVIGNTVYVATQAGKVAAVQLVQ